jgi:hypothetical protein
LKLPMGRHRLLGQVPFRNAFAAAEPTLVID